MFWIMCGFSGLDAGVQVKVRLFRSGCGCSGLGAGVLGKV